MDVETPAAAAAPTDVVTGKLDLVVVRASAAERAEHAKQLEAIDKASHGACLWLRDAKS